MGLKTIKDVQKLNLTNNTIMKKLILTNFLIVLFLITNGQENIYFDSYHSFLKYQYSDRYIDKGDIKSELINYNFSPLWILPGSTDIDYQVSGFTNTRQELKGFIGKDFQRIYIHFIQITKNEDNPNEYFVNGKSNVKGNICDFMGTMKIKLAREITFDYHPGEDFLVNIDSVKKQGVIICEYNFYENSTQEHSGKFSGILITLFYIDSNDKLKYNAIKGFSDSYINNQFIGNWTSYKTKKSKVCNFGEWRIPNSGDLNIGAGEFYPNEKYFDKGWNPVEQINYEWWK